MANDNDMVIQIGEKIGYSVEAKTTMRVSEDIVAAVGDLDEKRIEDRVELLWELTLPQFRTMFRALVAKEYSERDKARRDRVKALAVAQEEALIAARETASDEVAKEEAAEVDGDADVGF